MLTSTDDQLVVNEEVWRTWIQTGKLRDQAGARRRKVLAGIAFVLLAIGTVFYLAIR